VFPWKNTRDRQGVVLRDKERNRGQRYYSRDGKENYKKREQWPGIELRT